MLLTALHSSQINNTYYLHDTPFSSSDHCKYLGITLQSNLKYDKQRDGFSALYSRIEKVQRHAARYIII